MCWEEIIPNYNLELLAGVYSRSRALYGSLLFPLDILEVLGGMHVLAELILLTQ